MELVLVMFQNIKRESLKKINYLILLFVMFLFPLFDAINSLILRNFQISISLGMIVKGLFLIYLFMYFILVVKMKNEKKIFIGYIIGFIIWSILFILNRFNLLSFGQIFNECVYLFRFFYSSIILGLLYFFCEDNKFNKDEIKRLLVVAFISYIILLLIPYLTGTAFNSYKIGLNLGYNGWFYSANETSAIMILLFFVFLSYSLKEKLVLFIVNFLAVFIIMEIGTKVAFLGVLAVIIFYIILCGFKKEIKKVGYMFVLFIFALFVAFNGVAKQNMAHIFLKLGFDVKIENIVKPNDDIPTIEEEEEESNSEKIDYVDDNKILNILLSGRVGLFYDTLNIYNDSNLFNKIVGIGFSNNKNIDNARIEKLIEIDFLDIFFHFGILGFIIFLLPYLYFVYKLVNNIIKSKKINIEMFEYFCALALLFGISMMSGHVFSAPSVSLFYALLLLMLINCSKNLKDDFCDKKTME